MRLTVLGSSASYASAGQACAGYLVETGDTRVLLDCGHGVLANLARALDPLLLNAVFVTHGHIDHFADVYALQALLRYAPEGPADPMPLYAPEGLFDRMALVLSKKGAEELAAAFLAHSFAEGTGIRVGDVLVTPMRVDHGDDAFALRIEAEGSSICYTADTAPGDAAIAAAEGCDLLLAEATLPERYAGRAQHMTGREAGLLGRQSGAKQLVVTHVWPTNDRETVAREASDAYGSAAVVASEFDVFVLE
ncbi:MAG: MBL fold metallo-hydrolase [Coriobacteriia bacterium]|nr:MBL fold metallo-hydrolase [Coriobacteriia bacterium]